MDITLYLLVFAGVLFLAVVGTPLARQLGLRLNVVDQPDPRRKVHTIPTPRLGGVAIFLSTLLVTLILEGRYKSDQLTSVLVGASFISLLGFWDDRYSLSPWVKLAGQFVAAGLLIMTGVTIRTFPITLLNYAASFFWIVWITNSFNLLDNMDGLSGGIAAIAAGHFALMCTFTGQYLVGALAIAVMGACLGFLVYNWNPAMIFMGDSGSLFLGFTLAALSIKMRFPANVSFVTWMIPLLVLSVPIFDTSLVIISRLRRGLNPLTTPGKDHTSHRLNNAGLTRREAVLVLYIVAFSTGLVALFITEAAVIQSYVMGSAVASTALYALWRLEQAPFNRPRQGK